MIDNSDAQRDAIHAALQETGPLNTEDKSAVLSGWVVVTEWMDEDGDRWLAKAHAASLTNWTAAGFHHEALYGEWPEPGEDD